MFYGNTSVEFSTAKVRPDYSPFGIGVPGGVTH